METILLMLLIKTIKDRLGTETENIKLKLPESFGEERGKGSLLDPLYTHYPILDGLYSIETDLDNLVFQLEKHLEKQSQK